MLLPFLRTKPFSLKSVSISATAITLFVQLIEASDGQDALNKLGAGEIHMIITDLNMPNLDGIGLIRNVRTKTALKYVPIIMLTTESQDSRKQEGRTAGATGWIVKPFRPDQLTAVIKKVLG